MNRRLSALGWFVAGAALGTAALFFLDPVSGRRRRALVREKSLHYRLIFERTLSRRWHDLNNRAHGLAYKAGLWNGEVTKTITRTRSRSESEERHLSPGAQEAAAKGSEYIH